MGTKSLKAHQRAAESARPMPVSLQGPPEPPTQLALALATLLLRTRFGRSKLAMVLLLPNTLFPTDTAMLTLALRTLPLLVQPRPSKGRRSFQLFSPARTCLPTLLLRQTLVARQRGLCSCAFYLERWSGRLQNLLKDHYCTGSCY